MHYIEVEINQTEVALTRKKKNLFKVVAIAPTVRMLLQTDVEGQFIVRRTRGQTRQILRYTITELCNHKKLMQRIIKGINLPCRYLDVVAILRYHITRSCALTQCPFPRNIKGLVKALAIPRIQQYFSIYPVRDFNISQNNSFLDNFYKRTDKRRP